MKTVKIITDGDVPQYKTAMAAAVDLYAAEDSYTYPALISRVKTGVKIDMSETGLCALLLLRSSMVDKQLSLANGVGLIDPDYQGQILIALRYHGGESHGPLILRGERVAQLLFIQPERVQFERVTQFTPTERGEGGFGSTGK